MPLLPDLRFAAPCARGALLILLTVCCLFGQNVNGLIRGTVADPSGSALPGATLTLRNAARAIALTTTSNAIGVFVFPSVPPGAYDLAIEAPGFQKYVRTAIELNASENRDLGPLQMSFPLGLGEGRVLQFRGEFFNAFNHTQFSAIDSAASFNQAGAQVKASFGAFTAARNPRIIAFSLRLRL